MRSGRPGDCARKGLKRTATKNNLAENLLKQFRVPAEHEARRILASYGIAGPQERFVATAEEAAQAAAQIGFPVALKGMMPGMIHKSEAGMVKLRIASRRGGARSREKDGRSRVLVQKMMSPIAEILVGARVDPDFGPLIVVGAGGINVELYKDVAVRIAPITEVEALEALAATRISRVLDGWRGAPAGRQEGCGRRHRRACRASSPTSPMTSWKSRSTPSRSLPRARAASRSMPLSSRKRNPHEDGNDDDVLSINLQSSIPLRADKVIE